LLLAFSTFASPTWSRLTPPAHSCSNSVAATSRASSPLGISCSSSLRSIAILATRWMTVPRSIRGDGGTRSFSM